MVTPVFQINKPDPTEPSTSVMFIRQPGAFGPGGSIIFLVQKVEATREAVTVTFMDNATAMFSPDISYMVLPRDRVTAMSVQEMAEEEKKQREEWEQAYGQPTADLEDGAPVVVNLRENEPGVGQYL